jgi:hypothetical protein
VGISGHVRRVAQWELVCWSKIRHGVVLGHLVVVA